MFLFNNVFLPQDEGMSCYHRIMACFLPRTAFGEGLSQVEQVKRRMEETRAEMDDEREGHELRMDEYRGALDGLREKREKLDGQSGGTAMSDWMKNDPHPDQGQKRRR